MLNYTSNSYFDVSIFGTPGIPIMNTSGRFTRVSGLGVGFEYEYYNEGGSNYHRPFFKQVTQQTLVLEQGTVTDTDFVSIAANLINLGVDVSFFMIIKLCDNTGKPMRQWTIGGAHLTKYVGPELDANNSELAVSRLEFVYSGAF